MVLFLNCLLLIVGFIMLVKGADWFVDSAAGIAQKLHVPELVIGLTLNGFGTSAPELSVSLTSALNSYRQRRRQQHNEHSSDPWPYITAL